MLRRRTLDKLSKIQPKSGGYLEAIPLTGFVVTALSAMGLADHQVACRGGEFLVSSVREDGSWPVDIDLSTWLTTMGVGCLGDDMPLDLRKQVRDHLLNTQYSQPHPFTQADPGGWAWTDLSGGVPDVDDTSSALLALVSIGGEGDGERWTHSIRAGVKWLLSLQNRDGGWPTFCRGWGRLEFDRSSAELTAHAIAALSACRDFLEGSIQKGCSRAITRGVRYLEKKQRSDGSFVPLWFGNQLTGDGDNPVYGTARVVKFMGGCPGVAAESIIQRAVHYLLDSVNEEGAWGGAKDVAPSVEETAVATEALAIAVLNGCGRSELRDRVDAGCRWLLEKTDGGRVFRPASIGLYFARLWYFEDLYPPLFTLAALKSGMSVKR